VKPISSLVPWPGGNSHWLASDADDFTMRRTNEPLPTSGSPAKAKAASYLVLRYAGASGPATIPMAGPAPEALARR